MYSKGAKHDTFGGPNCMYTLDAVGSWQIILPMPKSERAY